MKCLSCKYYAVPLTEEELKKALCPGADPNGEIEKRICTLIGREGFEDHNGNPEKCKYYFPHMLRFR